MSKSTNTNNIDKRVHRGLAWVGLASSMVGLLDILATVLIVAFWVPKEDIGVAVLAYSIFPVLDLATDMGLASAVIQRDDHTQSKISTIFWLNVSMSVLMFGVLALGVGPILSWIHGHSILTGLFTVYGAKLIWQNVYFLPYALMKKEFRFKELSVIRIIANFAEFAGKIGFAASGFGIWCFVAGPLCRVLVTGIGVQLRHPWRPSFVFNFREGWGWATFGLKTSAHKILFRLYSMIDKQIVSYYFGDAALGVYAIAFQVVLEPALVISEITVNVAFPTFAKLKHDSEKLYEQLISFCKMNLVVMLLFVGFIFVAAEEILAIFSIQKGNDYSSGVPIIRLLCGVAILRALSFVIPPLLDGVGRPTLNLIYTAVAAIVLSILFVISAVVLGPEMGFVSVALAWLLGYPIAFVVLVLMAFSILERPARQLFFRLSGIAACGIVATACTGVAKWATLELELPVPARLAAMGIVMLLSFSFLLDRFQGINIRSIKKSL